MVSDCETNRLDTYSDGSPVFGRDECLVLGHAVETDSKCHMNCYGPSYEVTDASMECASLCPSNQCYDLCESTCLDYFTDPITAEQYPALADRCKNGCMNSCFEFKGSTHTCSGMANMDLTCAHFGTDPDCIAEGNCQFESAQNDCYIAFQIGCKVMGIDIHAQLSAFEPEDSAMTTQSPHSVYCQEKCMAIYGWMMPDMTSNCLVGCSYYESVNDITTPKEQES